jgi:hypothetical protein
MKIRLLQTLPAFAIGFAVPTFAQQKEPTPSESTPEATPTPTLGDHFTQVLPDRRVTFRLLAPKANDVKVLIGVTSGIYEGQGTTDNLLAQGKAVPMIVVGAGGARRAF